MNRCIAYRERQLRYEDKRVSVVYEPCGKKCERKRFCPEHDRAYRELLIGILQAGKRAK